MRGLRCLCLRHPQGYLDKILNLDTENETAKEQFIKIRKRMEQYLAARK